MATASELVLHITAKNDAEKELENVKKSAGGLGKVLGDVGKIAGGFVLAAGIMQAPQVLGSFVSAASNMNETLSKSNTIFKEQGTEVEKWAAGAAKSFGQSKQQALEAAGTFGNLFTQIGIGTPVAKDMSTQMTELASDFASFHNADITEVIGAQTAAFRGEYDALQRFVPTINAASVEQEALAMTGKATTKELTIQEKALATHALMMKGAGEAMGDFDKTSSGLANRQRILSAQFSDLQAKIGQALLPVMVSVAGFAVNTIIPAFEKLANIIGPVLGAAFSAVGGAAKTVLSVFSGMAAIIKGPSDGFGSFGGKVSKLGGAFKSIAGIIQTVLATFNGIKAAIKGPTDGFGSFGGKLVKLGGAFKFVVGVIQNGIPQLVSWFNSDLKPALDNIVTAARAVVSFIVDNWPLISQVVQPIINQLVNELTFLWNTISNIIALVVNLIQGDWAGAWENLKNIVMGALTYVLNTVRNVTDLLDGILNLFWIGLQAGAQLAWDGVIALIGLAWDGIKALVSAGVTEVTASFNHLLSEISRIVGGLPGLLIGLAQQAFDGFIGILNQIPGAIIGLAGEALNAARTMGANVYLGIKGEIEDLPGVLYDLGKKIIGGLASGISDSAHSVYNKAREIGQGIVDAAKRGLGDLLPGSPSKLGLEIPLAIAQGIAQNGYYAVKAADALGHELVKVAKQNSDLFVESFEDGSHRIQAVISQDLEAMRAALRSAEQMGHNIPARAYSVANALPRGMSDEGTAAQQGDMISALAHARKMGYTLPPGFAQGTSYVPRTGLAMLHKGEAVIPVSQNRGGATELHVHLENHGTIVGVQNAEQWVGQAVRNVMLRGGLDIIQRAV